MTKPSRFLAAAAAVAAIALSSAVAFAADAEESAGKKININQASATQLALLPRVGAKAADRIVEFRKSHGTFARGEELMEVKGIGEKLYGELKPYVALSGPTTLAAKVRSASTRGSRAARTSGSAGKKNASSSVPVGKGR